MRIIKSLFFVAATAVAPLSWSLSYDALGLDALPPGLEWKRGNPGPVTGSPEAKSGNTVRQHILHIPLTLRTVGPGLEQLDPGNHSGKPVVTDWPER